MYIHIEQYGDYDIRVHRVMLHHFKMQNMSVLNEEFFKLNNIKSFNDNDYQKYEELTSSYIEFLKTKGFREVHVDDTYFFTD